MMQISFDLHVSYSQVAIFQSALAEPFNDWKVQHVAQGFAWRPGSVSFSTLLEDGVYVIELDVVGEVQPVSPGAIRAIEVPMEVVGDGAMEVASISDSVSLTLPTGQYCLRCELFRDEDQSKPRLKLIFTRSETCAFSILRADRRLTAGEGFIITNEADSA
jgi:hypothetical protein